MENVLIPVTMTVMVMEGELTSSVEVRVFTVDNTATGKGREEGR